jgi:hypothetical protein
VITEEEEQKEAERMGFGSLRAYRAYVAERREYDLVHGVAGQESLFEDEEE